MLGMRNIRYGEEGDVSYSQCVGDQTDKPEIEALGACEYVR